MAQGFKEFCVGVAPGLGFVKLVLRGVQNCISLYGTLYSNSYSKI